MKGQIPALAVLFQRQLASLSFVKAYFQGVAHISHHVISPVTLGTLTWFFQPFRVYPSNLLGIFLYLTLLAKWLLSLLSPPRGGSLSYQPHNVKNVTQRQCFSRGLMPLLSIKGAHGRMLGDTGQGEPYFSLHHC